MARSWFLPWCGVPDRAGYAWHGGAAEACPSLLDGSDGAEHAVLEFVRRDQVGEAGGGPAIMFGGSQSARDQVELKVGQRERRRQMHGAPAPRETMIAAILLPLKVMLIDPQ